MSQPIIVGYEATEQSADAVALARTLAEAEDRPIIVAGIHEVDPVVNAYSPEFGEDSRKLRAAAEGAARGCGGEAVVLSAASAAGGLSELARETQAHAIVLGSCHRGVVGRSLMGSVARRLLHDSPVPIAVAPAGYRGARAALRRVGAAIDGGDLAHWAVEEGAAIARGSGGGLRLLCVAEPHLFPESSMGLPYGMLEVRKEMHERVAGYMQAARAFAPGVEIDEAEFEGVPAHALAEASEDLDLLVMGSHGRGRLTRAMVGSVARELLTLARCPLLVVPARSRKRGSEPQDAGAEATGTSGA